MRVLYHTFGCKANQYDTERIRQELEARGASTASSSAEADLCVLNTCTVTNQADAEARRFVRRLRRENADLEIVVVGCSAVLRPDEYRGMDGVLGVVEGHDPLEVAREVECGRHGELVQLSRGRPTAEEIPSTADRSGEPVDGAWGVLTRRLGASRGWLKIQDGCDRKCSFCATRLARGASRSRSPHEVVEEALVLGGSHPELVLTGIHIGHYGRDLEPGISLSRLVADLLEKVPHIRFRLGSVEATEIDELLLDLLESSGGRLAPHLHMPLQSGSNQVLARMRRWYTRERYRARTLDVVERVPRLGLGADVITGFPGESNDEFGETRELIRELPFTYLHVFPFSPRSGTAAADMTDPVPQRIAGERARELRELGFEKGREYRAGRAGQGATVVLEGEEGSRGLTGDYLRVDVRRAEPPSAGRDGEVGVSPDEIAPDGSHASGGEAAGGGRLRRGVLWGDGDHLYIDLSPGTERN